MSNQFIALAKQELDTVKQYLEHLEKVVELSVHSINHINNVSNGYILDPNTQNEQKSFSRKKDPDSKSIWEVAQEILKNAKQPLHVDLMIEKFREKGYSTTKPSLAGTLARYQKQNKIKKTSPNTYILNVTEATH